MYIIKKPRFFCTGFWAKSKIEKWRKSAKKFFHFCEKMCCKKTLVFLQRVKLGPMQCACAFAIFTRIDFPQFPVFYRNRGKEGVDCEQSEQDGAVQYNHNHTRCSNISQLPHRLRRSPPSFIKKGNMAFPTPPLPGPHANSLRGWIRRGRRARISAMRGRVNKTCAFCHSECNEESR